MTAIYQNYFDVMPCYCTVQDRNLNIVDANRRFRSDFGDWKGRRCFQVYKGRSEKCEVCPVERTFRDGQTHESEEKVRCLDGREVSVIVYTTPVRNEAGEIVSVMELSADITEVKVLQDKYAESRARYRQLFEEVPCYISIQDRDLRIVEANRGFREDFGARIGSRCFESYKHRTEECLPCPVQATFEDGQVHESEEVVTSTDGRQINVLVRTSPIRAVDGSISGVMEMSTNITEIRRLQSQLTNLGLLIGSVSHSIKGLINSLEGGIYLVNTGMAKNDQGRVQRGWEMVQRNVGRIKSTVLDILYYAKDRPLNVGPIEGEELIKEVKEVLAPRAAQFAIEWRDGCKPAAFAGDRSALRSALVNLTENAIDACRADGAKPTHTLTLSCGSDAEGVFFTVSDDGMGMDQETREKVFSLFFSSKGAQGTGLGLFVAGQIADKHGGRISVDSVPGQGSTFTLHLPTCPPTSPTPEV